MNTEHYYYRDEEGRERGPYGAAQIESMAGMGALTLATPIRIGADGEWQALETLLDTLQGEAAPFPSTARFEPPRVCRFLRRLSYGCGLALAWPVFSALMSGLHSTANDTTAMFAFIVAGIAAFIVFLVGMAPFYGFSVLIEYVTKIEWRLDPAASAPPPPRAGERASGSPSTA